MLKQLAIIIAFYSVGLAGMAQELNCQVAITTDEIQASDKSIYDNLQTELRDFMNNRKWTNDEFLNQERIDCSITIAISKRVSTDEFEASIQIQSRRPVYRSSYNSPMLNHKDKDFDFRYVQDQVIDFDESNISSNLTATLAYYAYIIIGLDYDSFSPEGGTPYFVKAQTIVNNAQNLPARGWKAFENTKNRYWLVENLLDVSFKPLRSFIYTYHRLGFDRFADNVPDARADITTSLNELRKVYLDKPGSFLMPVFCFTKYAEFVDLFKQATTDEKNRALQVFTTIDPAHTMQYQSITTGGK